MQTALTALLVAGSALMVGGCVVVPLAPGADQVRVTRYWSEVAGCKQVGYVRVPTNRRGLADLANAETQFRNIVVALGGNTGFVRREFLLTPLGGIAYSCRQHA